MLDRIFAKYKEQKGWDKLGFILMLVFGLLLYAGLLILVVWSVSIR